MARSSAVLAVKVLACAVLCLTGDTEAKKEKGDKSRKTRHHHPVIAQPFQVPIVRNVPFIKEIPVPQPYPVFKDVPVPFKVARYRPKAPPHRPPPQHMMRFRGRKKSHDKRGLTMNGHEPLRDRYKSHVKMPKSHMRYREPYMRDPDEEYVTSFKSYMKKPKSHMTYRDSYMMQPYEGYMKSSKSQMKKPRDHDMDHELYMMDPHDANMKSSKSYMKKPKNHMMPYEPYMMHDHDHMYYDGYMNTKSNMKSKTKNSGDTKSYLKSPKALMKGIQAQMKGSMSYKDESSHSLEEEDKHRQEAEYPKATFVKFVDPSSPDPRSNEEYEKAFAYYAMSSEKNDYVSMSKVYSEPERTASIRFVPVSEKMFEDRYSSGKRNDKLQSEEENILYVPVPETIYRENLERVHTNEAKSKTRRVGSGPRVSSRFHGSNRSRVSNYPKRTNPLPPSRRRHQYRKSHGVSRPRAVNSNSRREISMDPRFRPGPRTYPNAGSRYRPPAVISRDEFHNARPRGSSLDNEDVLVSKNGQYYTIHHRKKLNRTMGSTNKEEVDDEGQGTYSNRRSHNRQTNSIGRSEVKFPSSLPISSDNSQIKSITVIEYGSDGEERTVSTLPTKPPKAYVNSPRQTNSTSADDNTENKSGSTFGNGHIKKPEQNYNEAYRYRYMFDR